jgi:hypothetical protein
MKQKHKNNKYSHVAWIWKDGRTDHVNHDSVQKGRLPPVRIELTAFSWLFEFLDYETDALPTELKGPPVT